MAYISLPATFDAAGNPPDGRRHEIRLTIDDHMVPVGALQAERDIPVEVANKLAQNLAAMLNGRNPIHHFGEGLQMYFQPLAGGSLALNFRPKGDEGGVSKLGALFTVNLGFGTLIEDIRRTRDDVFKLFMGAVGREERRAVVRSEASGGRDGRKPVPPGGQAPRF